jgi:hypothetical protein
MGRSRSGHIYLGYLCRNRLFPYPPDGGSGFDSGGITSRSRRPRITSVFSRVSDLRQSFGVSSTFSVMPTEVGIHVFKYGPKKTVVDSDFCRHDVEGAGERRLQRHSNPRDPARDTASVLVLTASFEKMRLTCDFTVSGEISNVRATRLFAKP